MTTQLMLRDYLLTTEDAISAGRINDALVSCQYILTHFPESLEGQRLLGEVYLAQGQLEEAQQTFDWILTNDPENVIVYCDRALICEQMQDYDTALDCYQQAYELSRGNSEIRHEFNLLSEKVGQTSFIFSRAGLARLYMRGDLLSQAVQEWEIVLNASPDRLDARTGLLETLWREGLYDRVEQLATQILNDVPSCLKALLLLAHVTFPQNALKAQELLKQAETLDPDLIKAQELFSDFMAHSPKDPFLKLLNKTPITLPTTTQEHHASTSTVAHAEPHTNGTNGNAPYVDPLVRWSSLDNIIEPQQEYQPVQEATSFGNWSDASTTDFDGWSTFTQPPSPDLPIPAAQPIQQEPAGDDSTSIYTWGQQSSDEVGQDEALPDDWQLPQLGEEEQTLEMPLGQELDQEEPQPWYHVDEFDEPALNQWDNVESVAETASGISWGMDEQGSETPAPPAWLDMLTKNEWRQPAATSPSQPETQPVQNELTATPEQQDADISEEAEIAAPFSWSDQVAATKNNNPPSIDDEEPFFFGPEWLKSLGAAEIGSSVPQPIAQEQEQSPTALSAQSIAGTQQPIAQDYTSSPELAATPSSAPEMSMPQQSLESAAKIALPTSATSTRTVPSEEEGRPVFSTDETSATPVLPEQNENGSWLDSTSEKLSQPDQNMLTTLEEVEKDLFSQGFMPLEPGSLSSLAGVPNEVNTANEADDATLSSALAQFGNLGVAPVNTATAPSSIPPATPTFAPTDHSSATLPIQPEQPVAPATTSGSGSHSENQFDTELETTMKRPAVRLQAMQPRQQGQTTQPASSSQSLQRGRLGEPTVMGKTAHNSTNTRSYKERLLLGYQYQLAGSYDEAMQEYRIIIRNAPDLLGEVVSNMRALLKLAPQYSAGYRVLGDAYMRQGEYLQAMEAYNKALSMAKKAKS